MKGLYAVLLQIVPTFEYNIINTAVVRDTGLKENDFICVFKGSWDLVAEKLQNAVTSLAARTVLQIVKFWRRGSWSCTSHN